MKPLRILDVQVKNSTEIEVKFTDKLNKNIGKLNVNIISENNNIPNSEILKVNVIEDIIEIKCQPLTPQSTYYLYFISQSGYPFSSFNNQAKMIEDDISNKYLITGPISPDNPIKNSLLNLLKDNIYNANDNTSIIGKYIDSLSTLFAKTLYDIGQVKNENYLSFEIKDERKIRGEGPFDRLNEEGAYDLLRVGRLPSSSNTNMIIEVDEFQKSPISLQKSTYIENIGISSVNEVGKFNTNNLILTLNKNPVSKVKKLVFTLLTNNPIYEYNISKLGYQIKDGRYDQEYGFNYALLDSNQIKLNELILEDPLFSIKNIFKIEIEYEFLDLGRIIDETSIVVYSIKNSIRESLPPLSNVVYLKHAPIVDNLGNIINIDNITFTDPNQTLDGYSHPSFVYEIPFRLNALPSNVGQYAIDYENATIYIYGSDLDSHGTGAYPPLISYSYKHVYKPEQDFVYDSNLRELVALPKGNLIDNDTTTFIYFDYEETLIPNIDYKSTLHKEELQERIDNKLIALNALTTKYNPITNVFRIFNETSGEVYSIDRWDNNKIYFRYITPPLIEQIVKERASFNQINNEILFVDNISLNTQNLYIFTIILKNNFIISSFEDAVASFGNTTIIFSDSNLFINERWFNDELSIDQNIDRLQEVGEYLIDYKNGVIYCAMNNNTNYNLGTVIYKNNLIQTQKSHLISVEDIYYQISILNSKNKNFAYNDFDDHQIKIDTLTTSNECFLNNDTTLPYQIYNNQIGSFTDGNFVNGVTNQVKNVRAVYEYQDLLNSTSPLNFSNATNYNNFEIGIQELSGNLLESIQYDGVNYFVNIDQNILYISPNIQYTFSVIRTSDSLELWSGNINDFILEKPNKLILINNSPAEGEIVNINYSFLISDLSRVVVDYDKGDLFIDYTYLADEILVSYEYGDNTLDFRSGKTVSEGETYYVSYKVGALRDALLKNFGTLIDIPELSNFDIEFERENYRDALMAGLSSFIQGPTIKAMKNIGKIISHIEPEIIESIFNNWSLGSSILYPQEIKINGTPLLVPGKFEKGILLDSSLKSLTMPASSNFKFEEGTFECWTIPYWDGIDNKAPVTFEILKDGLPISSLEIFIGVAESHPDIISNKFVIDQVQNIEGVPNFNKDGIYIYYTKDISQNFNRWYMKIIDGYVDSNSVYKIQLSTTIGTFYDVKMIPYLSSNIIMSTSQKKINLSINNIPFASEDVLTFIVDSEHYIIDIAEDKNTNRFSIFKDVSGYLNFRIYDKNKFVYMIASDISNWKKYQMHHIAASWKIGTDNDKDEMHLFIDGFEIPNITKFGQKLQPYFHEKFRTLNEDDVLGISDKNTISSNDLITNSLSNIVESSINFSASNTEIGDTIIIDEVAFNTLGYTITNVNGQFLELNDVMPLSLTNGKFYINKQNFPVPSDTNLYSDIIVTKLTEIIKGIDLNGIINDNVVTSSTIDFETLNIKPGFIIHIDNINLKKIYTIIQVSVSSLTLSDALPININNEIFIIYPQTEEEISGINAQNPSYVINNDNTLTILNNVEKNDILIIRTLGLNHKKIKKEHFIWSNNIENILMTHLPPPTSLNNVSIRKIVLPLTSIGPYNSSILLGQFVSNNIVCFPCSLTPNGRTLGLEISGNNVDFSSNVDVNVVGSLLGNPISEIISFSNYGILETANRYDTVDYIIVTVTPLNINKNALNILIKEKYPITFNEEDGYSAAIRYSYAINSGVNLFNDSTSSVRDERNIFSDLYIGNCLYISSPINVVGFYKIASISPDRKTMYLETMNGNIPSLTSFTNGNYTILYSTDQKSGLQNGFFTLEIDNQPSAPYYLTNGLYELEYYTYANINLHAYNNLIHIGTDFQGQNHLDAVLDEVKISSEMLKDIRIGEDNNSKLNSITKDFNSLKPLKKDKNTLVLLNFDIFPIVNIADVYISTLPHKLFSSSFTVNDNFEDSIIINNKPLLISNDGILDSKKEGSIEFWISPLLDTNNDYNPRFYFDAFSTVVEELVSSNNVTIKLTSPVKEVISITLKNDSSNTDYFAGGKIELDIQDAIMEEAISTSNVSVDVSKAALQVISVKIIDDLMGTEYFNGEGSLSNNRKTIYLDKLLPSNNVAVKILYKPLENTNEIVNTQIVTLNKKLPHHNSKVIIKYIPKGLQGDRICIFKDTNGFINFGITASGVDYITRREVTWIRGTWHRIKATYKINGKSSNEMRLFLDGYQCDDILYGNNLISGNSPVIFGNINTNDGYSIGSIASSLSFKDPINTLFLGSQYDNSNPAYGIYNNFRISNISRPIYKPYGEAIDVNYHSNIISNIPVTVDLYTTYLLDFNKIVTMNDNFTLAKNKKTGLFDFSVNIFDSFGIVNNIKVKAALEKLIKVLKPANSKVFIQYIK